MYGKTTRRTRRICARCSHRSRVDRSLRSGDSHSPASARPDAGEAELWERALGVLGACAETADGVSGAQLRYVVHCVLRSGSSGQLCALISELRRRGVRPQVALRVRSNRRRADKGAAEPAAEGKPLGGVGEGAAGAQQV